MDQSAEVRLAISADLRYAVWINSQKIGFGPPKFHAATPTVDHYDLSDLVRLGNNVIVVQVYSLGLENISSCAPRRGALWVDLSIGARHIVSDRTWKMRKDPGYQSTMTAPRGTQPPNECYDARLGLFRPWEEDHVDSSWPFARILSSDSIERLEDRDIPFMGVEAHLPDRLIGAGIAHFSGPVADFPLPHFAEEINQAELRPDRDNFIRFVPGSLSQMNCTAHTEALSSREAAYFIWDLGRVWSGYPVLHVTGSPGTVVDISYGEHLWNGRVNPAKSRMHYFDRMILGARPLEHRVTWPKSARYIQLHVHGGTATVQRVEWERSTYPVQRVGNFSSNSPGLDQAVEISLHTVQLCMEDSYMDSPWRERGSWLGDDLLKAQAAYGYFQDYALARRFLLHHARGQQSNGMLQGKYPGNVTSHVSTWTLRFPSSLLEYCAESGDWDLAEFLWPTLVRIMEWLALLQTPLGLYQAPPATVTEHCNRYNFIDWAPIDMRGVNSAWNAFAYEALHCIEKIARQIGKDRLVEEISERRRSLRIAFQTHLWDDRRTVFANGLVNGALTERWGCHENYLALIYKLASDDQTVGILQRLQQEDLSTIFEVDLDRCESELPGLGKIPTVSLALSEYRWPASKMVPIGTPYFAGYMIDALSEAGMVPEAMRFLEKYWGEFSRQGATTVWETWNTEQSLSHGWSAIPAVFVARTILGVRREEMARESWQILPSVECLRAFRGRVGTRFGPVQVEWEGGVLSVDVPAGGTFLAGLPGKPGESLWANDVQMANPVTLKRNKIDYLAIPVHPGKTRLQIR